MRDQADFCPFVYKDAESFTIVCPVCLFEDTLNRRTPIERLQRSRVCAIREQTRQLGWGDRTEWMLGLVGITKVRWVRFRRWWRSGKAKTCGCNKRQQKMNQLGWRFRYWLAQKTWPIKWLMCRVQCWLMPKPVSASPRRRQVPLQMKPPQSTSRG